jgi:hypothetical protein
VEKDSKKNKGKDTTERKAECLLVRTPIRAAVERLCKKQKEKDSLVTPHLCYAASTLFRKQTAPVFPV